MFRLIKAFIDKAFFFQCHIAIILLMPTILNSFVIKKFDNKTIQNGGHQQNEDNVTFLITKLFKNGGHQQNEDNVIFL